MEFGVSFRRDGLIARITIENGSKRNALSLGIMDALVRFFEEIEKDFDIRLVVLTGEGEKSFAAGADLDELPEVLSTAENAKKYDAAVTDMYMAIQNCRVPVVARIAGAAIGGGCLLALACDLRIAADHVKLGFPPARVGLMLSPFEYGLILDHLSQSVAKELVFTSKMMSADKAQFYGLLNAVTNIADLDTVVNELAENICAGAPLVIAASKRIMSNHYAQRRDRRSFDELYESIYPSEDLTEGLLAIKSKRQPIFTGK